MSWAESKWIVDQVTEKMSPRPNHMRMFEAEPLSKSSIMLTFLEPADSTYPDGTLLCAVEGVMIRMSTSGYPTSPSEGTLVIDNKVLGKYETEGYVVNGLTENTKYYFTAFPYSVLGLYNTSVNDANKTTVTTDSANIYGIKRDTNASSPAWTRTGAAIGKSATASVGTVAGSSGFDSCMPWKGMVREQLSTGDVMVKIPKFYFRRYIEKNIEYIQIADGEMDGFSIHPAFNHGNKPTDYIYVGAYKTVSGNKSLKGYSPLVDQTKPSMRSGAESKGTGWGLIDISTLSAIQMLMMVEYATNDMQTAIGRGYIAGNNKAIATGSCDSVPNLTGVPSGTAGKVDVVYRGIEGLWGNVLEWVDGIRVYSMSYYICNNPVDYADDSITGYTKLAYAASTSGYISKMGLDSTNPHIMLPIETNGSESTYYCDYSSYASGWSIARFGGYWNDSDGAGLFRLAGNGSSPGQNIGSRLLFLP